MSFLASIVASLVEWLLSKLGALGLAEIKHIEQDSAIESQSQKDVEQLKDAKTDEDKSQAARTIADNTFH